MKVYCPYCRKEVEYKIEKRDIKEFRKIEVNTYENVAVCKECHKDLYVNEIEEENNERINVTYIEKNNNKQQELISSLDCKKVTNNDELNIYNGYMLLDIEKVENIISYIASKVKNLTITSLNKYLWFIDIVSFNQRSVSITGLTYQNQKFGPTIIDKKYDEISLLNDKYIREDIETENGNTTKIISVGNYNLEKISDIEKEIIDTVIQKLKDKTVTDISELSHKEDGWKKTKRLEKISFEYAINLNIIK